MQLGSGWRTSSRLVFFELHWAPLLYSSLSVGDSALILLFGADCTRCVRQSRLHGFGKGVFLTVEVSI